VKILYISPENTVGTLPLWKKIHESNGNTCDIITLYRTKYQDDIGICLDLPMVSTNKKYINFRHKYYKYYRGELGDYTEREGCPPTWSPNSFLEKKYFQFRDWVWSFYIEPAIKKYNLYQYDIYHFEWGLGLYRDSRFVKRLAKMDKHIGCTYHGQDIRTRGVMPGMDKISQLNLTSELDLLRKHPNMNYLFLPFDTTKYSVQESVNKTLKVCHSPTNRYYKGSEHIIPICEKLDKKGIIEFILIEGQPYEAVLKQKQECDILIDQIYNRGGWGYGMNSVEALSMGLICMTELVQEYQQFIPDNPFINITHETLESKIKQIVSNKEKVIELKKKSKEWVEKKHSLESTASALYDYYRSLQWI